MKITKLFNEFFNSERAGGFILIICTFISLILANSPFEKIYYSIWSTSFLHHDISHWINDGLMTIFFLLIGLELEREFYLGELSNLRNASLPIVAAIGGMLMPVLFFSIFNYGRDTQAGAGIPMATDIAFAIGILSMLGQRVPNSLKVLLTAIAVIDDLGSIVVISVFYTQKIHFSMLIFSVCIFGLLLVFNRLKIFYLWLFLFGGLVMWFFMLNSGVHPTIVGVLLAFAIPFGDGTEQSPSFRLQHWLHKPVAYFILPVFALANTSITFESTFYTTLMESQSMGIIAGLVLGKPLGIFLFCFLACILGICTLPHELRWKHIFGVGLLGGIGFTMSIFISLLAYGHQNEYIVQAKIAILLASFISATLGYFWISRSLK